MPQHVFYEMPDGKQYALEAAYFLPLGARIVAVFGEFVSSGDVIVYADAFKSNFAHVQANKPFPQDAMPIALLRDKRLLTCLEDFEEFVHSYARGENLIITEESY